MLALHLKGKFLLIFGLKILQACQLKALNWYPSRCLQRSSNFLIALFYFVFSVFLFFFTRAPVTNPAIWLVLCAVRIFLFRSDHGHGHGNFVRGQHNSKCLSSLKNLSDLVDDKCWLKCHMNFLVQIFELISTNFNWDSLVFLGFFVFPCRARTFFCIEKTEGLCTV